MHPRQPLSMAVALLVIAGLGLSACGSGHPKAAAATPSGGKAAQDMPGMDMPATTAPLKGAPVATDKVTVNNFAFMPAIVTVKVGTTVTWTNMDEEPHTVTDGADGIKSPVLGNQGSTFSFTFSKPGTYSYNCSIHPFMHGMVEVTA